ncbi:MAG TPA: hypothetical protein VGF86_12395 [Candidatus Tumulicola sp.]|jgi:hypothetical protein
MAKKLERPRKESGDYNINAARIVALATGEKLPAAPKPKLVPAPVKKNRAAVALGRRGGLKGGKARAASLTPEERRAIAIKAAHARWGMTGDETQDKK